MRKLLMTAVVLSFGFVGFGCSDETKTTTKETYDTTVAKPATVTKTVTEEVKVNEHK